MRKRCMALAAVSFCCLLSCGLESSPYLEYVRDDYVFMEDISRATVPLPTASAEGYGSYFTNFVIFYRIYISADRDDAQVITAERRNIINPTLNYDFNLIEPSTNKTSTTVNTSNLESSFFNRSYFQLLLEGAEINNVLSSGSLGRTLEISFVQTQGLLPTLSLDGGLAYPLRRANSARGLNFNPLPEDRRFLNHADLYSGDNATPQINADVVNLNRGQSQTEPPPQYTYVSMYIAAVGRDYLTTVYSQPTHIGVFRLPESF